ncbi:SLC13 family permease [Streptomyces sp. NPDC053493]|uniref:SLC13 family permease n=1 Tax=Streptomyces sp. NPDC053493 TaxID=3365705 RepID=UPI0037D0D1AB
MLPESLSVAALAAVLICAVARPRGLSEAVFAIPAAVLLILCGAVSLSHAHEELSRLAPVVGFLAAALVLAKLCDDEGLFHACGTWMAGWARGRPRRLLGAVFGLASLITAALSLDATVVLLTPVVFATATRMRTAARPHSYAAAHLSNTASLLLPVSNLTNLLAFTATGLGFTRFALVMLLPWVAAIAVEYVVIRRFFSAELPERLPGPLPVSSRVSPSVASSVAPRAERSARPAADGEGEGGAGAVRTVEHSTQPSAEAAAAAAGDAGPAADAATERPELPLFALITVAATLLGFGVTSALGLDPAWAAAAGASVLAVRALLRRRTTPVALVRSAALPFLGFVLALGVVVRAMVDNGLGAALGGLLPGGTSLPALLGIAALAAVLANLINNLPAVLALAPLAAPAGPAAVLAVLLGVNIGPNLTYAGSLATLLWRRIARAHGHEVELGEFTRLGLISVPLTLLAATVALWLSAGALL